MPVEAILIALIVLPLLAGLVTFLSSRFAGQVSLAVAVLQLGLVFPLAGNVLAHGPLRYEIGGWTAPLGIEVYADGLSVVMLLMTSIVAAAVNCYATGMIDSGGQEGRDQRLFWPISLLLWAALNALFVAGDIFNWYVTLELLTLSAVALIGLAGTVAALTAALRYLLFAIAASLFYLLGVALLYSGYGTVDWDLLAGQFRSDLPSLYAMVLMMAGLLLKTAIFPLHFWLPAAHANAPAPASALLSALVLKASFYMLFRLWFSVFPYLELPSIGQLLSGLGVLAILWGSLLAIRESRLKLLIAYSTVAQVGYLFLVFSLSADAAGAWGAWSATALFAVSHACGKAAAFMAAGSLQYATDSREIASLAGAAHTQPVSVLAFAMAGVGLIGLPPSGAFVAKWMLLEAALAGGHWELAVAMMIGGVLAAIYVFRVLAGTLAGTRPSATRRVPLRMQWVPLLLALFSLILGGLASPTLRLLEVGAPFSPLAAGALP